MSLTVKHQKKSHLLSRPSNGRMEDVNLIYSIWTKALGWPTITLSGSLKGERIWPQNDTTVGVPEGCSTADGHWGWLQGDLGPIDLDWTSENTVNVLYSSLICLIWNLWVTWGSTVSFWPQFNQISGQIEAFMSTMPGFDWQVCQCLLHQPFGVYYYWIQHWRLHCSWRSLPFYRVSKLACSISWPLTRPALVAPPFLSKHPQFWPQKSQDWF